MNQAGGHWRIQWRRMDNEEFIAPILVDSCEGY